MIKSHKNIKNYEDMVPEEKVKYLENKNLYLEVENEYLKMESYSSEKEEPLLKKKESSFRLTAQISIKDSSYSFRIQ